MNYTDNHIANNDALNSDTGFEIAYLSLRQKEKRIYTDGQLLLLPDIAPDHLHFKEWQIRKQSCSRLITYLKKKNKALKILEMGCGNGWLSANLAEMEGSEIIGLDINKPEIDQAKNVFKKSNLEFIVSSFPSDALTEMKFDIILFAASVQYFASFPDTIKQAFKYLTQTGEIHIADTHFYKSKEISGAVKRSQQHFTDLGHPEMARYYYHHSINDLKMFNYRILANPRKLLNRLKKQTTFYWVVIKPD